MDDNKDIAFDDVKAVFDKNVTAGDYDAQLASELAAAQDALADAKGAVKTDARSLILPFLPGVAARADGKPI